MSNSIEAIRHRIKRLKELDSKPLSENPDFAMKLGDIDCSFVLDQYDELQKRLIEAEFVLAFYSKKENYTELHDYKGLHNFTTIGPNDLQDNGNRARAYFKKHPQAQLTDEDLLSLSDGFWATLSGTEIPKTERQFFDLLFKPIIEIYKTAKLI